LTSLGKKIFSFSYKKRQLELVRQILKHPVFYDVFSKSLKNGDIIPKFEIIAIMEKHNLNISGDTVDRRSSSVKGWVNWIFDLLSYEQEE
jgi:hypothetical protein